MMEDKKKIQIFFNLKPLTSLGKKMVFQFQNFEAKNLYKPCMNVWTKRLFHFDIY